jgi:hypothetical protein
VRNFILHENFLDLNIGQWLYANRNMIVVIVTDAILSQALIHIWLVVTRTSSHVAGQD